VSATVEQRLTEMWDSPHTVRGWFATVDHKTLGKRYLASLLSKTANQFELSKKQALL